MYIFFIWQNDKTDILNNIISVLIFKSKVLFRKLIFQANAI